MLKSVDVGRQSLGDYVSSAGEQAVAELRELAAGLAGARVLHVNATPYGGGVAEILRSEVPLLRDLGLAADWKLITGDAAFFEVTKKIHNALQGAPEGLSEHETEVYLSQSVRNAALLEEEYDVVVVHDPQPLALPAFRAPGSTRWVWRCHIDTAEPNASVWAFLRPFAARYDVAVFTLPAFVPEDLPCPRVDIVAPAIDPASPKNLELDRALARRILGWIGVEPDGPLAVQVSRFDPWKDPLGVVAAYRLAREEVPQLELALVGSMALDDPEGWEVYDEIQEAVGDDAAINVFTNVTGVGNIEVNAFQRLADVAIQKSIREGFGLVVSETLWKGTPVVAGRAGGIPIQMPEGVGGFLVDGVEECAERLVELLTHPEHARELGSRGREHVREHFLLPRLLADELRLYRSLLLE